MVKKKKRNLIFGYKKINKNETKYPFINIIIYCRTKTEYKIESTFS